MKVARFIGSSQGDWYQMPEEVQDVLGYDLHLLQSGRIPPKGKQLKGMGGGVWELRDDFNTNTYRAVCVVRYEDAVYVLHCFQKKSKTGIGMPKADKFIIESRLKELVAKRGKSTF